MRNTHACEKTPYLPEALFQAVFPNIIDTLQVEEKEEGGIEGMPQVQFQGGDTKSEM